MIDHNNKCGRAQSESGWHGAHAEIAALTKTNREEGDAASDQDDANTSANGSQPYHEVLYLVQQCSDPARAYPTRHHPLLH